MRSILGVALALLASRGCAVKRQGRTAKTPSGMTVSSCQTLCQRFGMKSIGSQFEQAGEATLGGEFKQMSSPVACADKCKAVLDAQVVAAPTAFLQREAVKTLGSALKAPSGLTVTSCQTMCQRFGMKSIGSQFEEIGEAKLGGEFKLMSSPVACADKCKEVLTAQDASQSAVEAAKPTALSQGKGTSRQGCASGVE